MFSLVNIWSNDSIELYNFVLLTVIIELYSSMSVSWTLAFVIRTVRTFNVYEPVTVCPCQIDIQGKEPKVGKFVFYFKKKKRQKKKKSPDSFILLTFRTSSFQAYWDNRLNSFLSWWLLFTDSIKILQVGLCSVTCMKPFGPSLVWWQILLHVILFSVILTLIQCLTKGRKATISLDNIARLWTGQDGIWHAVQNW